MPDTIAEMQFIEFLELYPLEQLKRYQELVEDLIDGLKGARRQLAEHQLLSLTDQAERDRFLREHDAELHELDFVYPHQFRNSVVVTAFSWLEGELASICTRLKQNRALRLSWSDLRGDFLTRARMYISEVAGLPFPSDTEAWQEVQQFHRLRNCIVHTAGRLGLNTKNNRTATGFARSKGWITGAISGQQLALDRTACEVFLGNLRQLVEAIHQTTRPIMRGPSNS